MSAQDPGEVPVAIELSILLELSAAECWPDGDIPENWAAADVLKLVTDCHSTERFLREWGNAGAEVVVIAKGEHVRGSLW